LTPAAAAPSAIHSFFAHWDPKNGTQGAEPWLKIKSNILFQR